MMIPYNTFKQAVLSYALKVYYFTSGPIHTLIARTNTTTLTTRIMDEVDVADFVSNLQYAAVLVTDIDEALVLEQIRTNTLKEPTDDSGRKLITPTIFPSRKTPLYLATRGDSETVVNGSDHFRLQKNTSGDVALEANFLDVLYLSGGGIHWEGAEWGDTVKFEVIVPTNTPDTEDPAPNVVIVGHVIVPASVGATHNADYNTLNLIPCEFVTGEPKSGFFDLSLGALGHGIAVPNEDQAGDFMALDVAAPIARYVPEYSLLGGGDVQFNIPNLEPATILPGWVVKTTLHNENGHAGLQLSWFLITARYRTV